MTDPRALARAISVVAHPAVLVPVAVGALAARQQPPLPSADLAAILGAVCAVALTVLAWSAWRVRQGRWTHVDASVRSERRELNRLLFVLLVSLAVGLQLAGQPRPIVAGMACAAAWVGAAALLARWLKVSQHVGFASLSATLAWPQAVIVVPLALATVALAWSRRVLGRHSRVEVVVGAATGVAAGLGYHAAMHRFPGG